MLHVIYMPLPACTLLHAHAHGTACTHTHMGHEARRKVNGRDAIVLRPEALKLQCHQVRLRGSNVTQGGAGVGCVGCVGCVGKGWGGREEYDRQGKAQAQREEQKPRQRNTEVVGRDEGKSGMLRISERRGGLAAEDADETNALQQ